MHSLRAVRVVAMAAALLASLCLAEAAASEGAAPRTTLTIYTALEPEQHGPFKAAIEAAVPDVSVLWVWGQTGDITERLLAERAMPRADMVLGLAATSMIAFKKLGMLLPYRPANAEALRQQFRDATPPYTWTGMDAYLGVICFNPATAGARISEPVSWRDLLAPALKGRVVMPDPTRTGTGYLLVAGWLQSMGEAGGWAFMDALHENVSAYLPTGAGPCVEASEGRTTVGLTYDMRAAVLKAGGAPIRLVVPIDGVGWEEEAFGILAGTAHADLARKVADWAASRDANRLYGETFAMVAHPDAFAPPANYPPYAEARMIRSDLGWMAENRPRILGEWSRRYGAKAVPPR